MDRHAVVLIAFSVLASGLGGAPAEERPDFMLVAKPESRAPAKPVDSAEQQYNRWLVGAVAKDGNRAVVTMNCHSDVRDLWLAECKSQGWWFFDFPQTKRGTGVFKLIAVGGELTVEKQATMAEPPLIVQDAPAASVFTLPAYQSLPLYTQSLPSLPYGGSSACPNGQCPLR